jgi:hypothetical protein
VRLLHQINVVFGDLWDPNILYEACEGCVVLVDFDWPGMDGESRYPVMLNTSTDWPDNVLPYGIMRKAHDLWQVDRLTSPL